jgi:hypothetical protein
MLHLQGTFPILDTIMYLIVLLVAFAIFGVFAVQNDGTQVFQLLGYSWRLPTWAPAAVGMSVVSVLLLLHMSHAGIGSRLIRIGHGRSLDQHRDTIDELRAENGRLRVDLAAARGRAEGAAEAGAGPRRSLADTVRSLTGQDRSTA